MSAIEIKNLTVGYNRHPALHHINASLPLSNKIAIVGNNGSGKSTLIKTIMGDIQAINGEVCGLPCSIAYLPQVSGLQRDFPITVFDLVATGLWGRKNINSLANSSVNKKTLSVKRLLGIINAQEKQDCHDAIAAVGLHGFEKRNIDTISGGQLQRALFARVIVENAELILLDEPFIAIDERTTKDLLLILQNWQDLGKTVIVVLHDLELVRQHFPYVMILARELVACGKTEEVLTTENWQLSQKFLEAYDEKAHECEV